MKFLLNRGNLVATHYDNGDHVLEFDICGMKAFVTVRGLGIVEDEYYWDNEDNLQAAIADVNEEDIDVRRAVFGDTVFELFDTEDGIVFEQLG